MINKPILYIDFWDFPKEKLEELDNMGFEIIKIHVSDRITTKDLVKKVGGECGK